MKRPLPHDGWERLDHRDKSWHSFHYNGWASVVPVCDLYLHDSDNMGCPCRPFWDPSARILLHHAFDGRDLIERVEQGFRIL